MPSRQSHEFQWDVPDATARERRLKVLRELERRIGTEPPGKLCPAPEDLIRGDRER
jgi:hypothetical protein